ncbi:plastid transcriptionally active 5 [Raphanus sativus]|nr:plastid transcriptionally active 5 [Raphanus sativus]
MASSSLPLSLPLPLRSRGITRPLTFRHSHHLFLSLPSSIVCLSTQNPSSGYDREESRWVREEQRWIREEQRWLREEQRWTRERETLLQEIADLQLRIQTLESQSSVPDTISNIAALLQVLKEKNRIAESGSSATPMVLENTRELKEEEEEEVVVEKQVVAEEKIRVKKRVTLKVGSEGEEVQAMQEALLKLGFYSGEEDMEFSSFSSGTASAVKTWQASLGVREDGIMTEELLQMLFMDQDVKTDMDEANTIKQETKEAGNGAVKTQVSEKQQTTIKDQGNRGNEVSQHRVFLLGENRWEDPTRLNKPINTSESTDTIKKCVTCRGEGRLMCLECDGTGEPNIEPQFMELVDEDAKCVYCEGLGYTVCDVCEGT